MKFTPSRFWTTKGCGESNVSKLNAIDSALNTSGLGYQNHIAVSSIPPAKQIFPKINPAQGTTLVPLGEKFKEIPISSIIHVVKAIKTGHKGENLASCIALAKVTIRYDEVLKNCVFAFESSGYDKKIVESHALAGVRAMITERSVNLDTSWGDSGFKLISENISVKKEYGCVICFVVFDPFSYI